MPARRLRTLGRVVLFIEGRHPQHFASAHRHTHGQDIDHQQIQNAADHRNLGGHVLGVIYRNGDRGALGQRRLAGGDGDDLRAAFQCGFDGGVEFGNAAGEDTTTTASSGANCSAASSCNRGSMRALAGNPNRRNLYCASSATMP